MKALFRLLAAWLLLAAPGLASAQLAPIDTTGGRYYRPVFSAVTVTSGVVYGSAAPFNSTTPQALLLDVYQPAGDTVARRPLIIFAHQGGFFLGSKTDPYMVSVCTRLARLGYVTASIDYRLGYPLTGLA